MTTLTCRKGEDQLESQWKPVHLDRRNWTATELLIRFNQPGRLVIAWYSHLVSRKTQQSIAEHQPTDSGKSRHTRQTRRVVGCKVVQTVLAPGMPCKLSFCQTRKFRQTSGNTGRLGGTRGKPSNFSAEALMYCLLAARGRGTQNVVLQKANCLSARYTLQAWHFKPSL